MNRLIILQDAFPEAIQNFLNRFVLVLQQNKPGKITYNKNDFLLLNSIYRLRFKFMYNEVFCVIDRYGVLKILIQFKQILLLLLAYGRFFVFADTFLEEVCFTLQ